MTTPPEICTLCPFNEKPSWTVPSPKFAPQIWISALADSFAVIRTRSSP